MGFTIYDHYTITPGLIINKIHHVGRERVET
jgi:hypothetical protein